MGPHGRTFIFWMLSLSQFFTLLFHFHHEALQFFTFCHKGGVICIFEVTDISSGNLDSSLCFFQPSIYKVVLVSAIQWSEFFICLHISPPSWTSLPPTHSHRTTLSHRREQSWAPCAIQKLPLCGSHGSVCTSVPPSPALHPQCLHTHSLYLWLCPCPANRFICTIFLDSTHMR